MKKCKNLQQKRLYTGAGEKKFKTAPAPKGLKSPAPGGSGTSSGSETLHYKTNKKN